MDKRKISTSTSDRVGAFNGLSPMYLDYQIIMITISLSLTETFIFCSCLYVTLLFSGRQILADTRRLILKDLQIVPISFIYLVNAPCLQSIHSQTQTCVLTLTTSISVIVVLVI